ncbi:bifunctional ribonuclease/(p)ppGpp synthase [Mycobacterium sp. 236(2023)]|uniref:bifunctional ribonuclease/(p)ppGpp synthase n=1 Tax=Mycobacterium sp. 236(2023) TaxID=3038163 RepID=UPI00241543E7|nr:bifunctional ribonuclease/(p)ppGpp synthase [Mycobacterium sp. 236(2023)]MDG4665514.1 bifunctional ribonuclease/(p)ppGpp synthase [Mycobacterium sp. 236(2023)]
MHFVGLDLAWGEKNQTGVAVVDSDGRLLHVGAATDDDSIAAAVEPFTKDECLVAIDAPLIVKNETGHRPAETRFNRDFQRFEAGARPAFRERPEFKHPRAARIAERLGLDMDPASSSPRRAIEVYPHPATVVLFELDRTLKYKRGPFEERQRELLRLMTFIEGLDDATPRLRANRSVGWVELRKRVEAATKPSHLDRDEDPVDAVICAYIGLYWYHRPEDVTIYGDFATGYIVTPSLPEGRRAKEPRPIKAPPPPAAPSAAVAEYAERRPALVTATDHYLELVTGLLDDAGINYLSVTARTKTVESFAAKTARRAPDGTPLYSEPLVEITDLIGLRVITYLREDVVTVANLLTEELKLLDDRDMGQETAREGRWGYASRHLLVGVEGVQQPASIQVRTVLQHAWAEFEHEIRYKGSIPAAHAPDLDRRFTLAAGLLELADREFSAVRERLRTSTPDTSTTEITSDPRIPTAVLATYLGNRFPDAGWSRTDHYAWIAGLLLELGIDSIDEVDDVLDDVDTDAVNAAMDYRYPAGAVRRLDDALLAVFGHRYLDLQGNSHRIKLLETRLARLQPNS